MTARKRRTREPYSDEGAWADATSLSASETKGTKVHLTVRLDPALYKRILAEKRAGHDATTTATVERLLHERFAAPRADDRNVVQAVRRLLVRAMYHEALLSLMSRLVRPRSRKEKVLLEQLERVLPSDPASEEAVARLSGILLTDDLAESLRGLGADEGSSKTKLGRAGGVSRA